KCIHDAYGEMPVVSISNSQRAPLPRLKWVGTIYHGIPSNLYEFNPDPDNYLVFVGRIAPEKRVDRAIQIAAMSGYKLKIVAKIDPQDQDYYLSDIEPLLRRFPMVEFVGEANDADKQALMGNAKALLFPIEWNEPFGLVLIEA